MARNGMEVTMTHRLFHTACYATAGVALIAGLSVAEAQTVPPAAVMVEPAATAPVETVETVRTVRSTTVPRHKVADRRVGKSNRLDRVTTTRTIVRERVVPARSVVVAPAVAAVTQPGYTEVVQAPVVDSPDYPAPLYDAVPGSQPVFGAPGFAPPAYRYIYEPDRILVVDPLTGIAVQSLPR
jgi:hypothetical protein